jgi:hypothetical protein
LLAATTERRPTPAGQRAARHAAMAAPAAAAAAPRVGTHSGTFRVGDWVLDARRIGRGSFADVFRAAHAVTGAPAAAKEVDLARLAPGLRRALAREVGAG